MIIGFNKDLDKEKNQKRNYKDGKQQEKMVYRKKGEVVLEEENSIEEEKKEEEKVFNPKIEELNKKIEDWTNRNVHN